MRGRKARPRGPAPTRRCCCRRRRLLPQRCSCAARRMRRAGPAGNSACMGRHGRGTRQELGIGGRGHFKGQCMGRHGHMGGWMSAGCRPPCDTSTCGWTMESILNLQPPGAQAGLTRSRTLRPSPLPPSSAHLQLQAGGVRPAHTACPGPGPRGWGTSCRHCCRCRCCCSRCTWIGASGTPIPHKLCCRRGHKGGAGSWLGVGSVSGVQGFFPAALLLLLLRRGWRRRRRLLQQQGEGGGGGGGGGGAGGVGAAGPALHQAAQLGLHRRGRGAKAAGGTRGGSGGGEILWVLCMRASHG